MFTQNIASINSEKPVAYQAWHGASFPADKAADPALAERLALAKRSYITRRMDLDYAQLSLATDLSPRAGDLLLAEVTGLGHHRRLEDPHGRRRYLYVGDEVLLCYAARYATDQFEAVVPADLQPCHMVAAGGIAAQCVSRNSGVRPATGIRPVGLVTYPNGLAVNLADFAQVPLKMIGKRPDTLTVLGTSMNSGKTTTAAALTRYYTSQGIKVGVGKITGTGAGGDRWKFTDAGAHCVLDFSDFGYASTFQLSAGSLMHIAEKIVAALTAAGSEKIILEVADGIFFSETAELVQSQTFQNLVDEVVLSASDSAGAFAGEQWLKQRGLNPRAIAGTLTSSPLAVREAQHLLSTPVVPLKQIKQQGLDGDA